MTDVLVRLEGALVHHGPANDRAYLMKLGADAEPAVVATALDELAVEKDYGKIVAKVPAPARADFAAAGYCCEATIPRPAGDDDIHFMAKYRASQRAEMQDAEQVRRVLAAAEAKAAEPEAADSPLPCRAATPTDAEAMADVYRQVFASYPFPIDDPGYLRRTMAEHVAYFGAWDEGRPVALSSAEMDPAGGCVEMTDFATLPAYRGRGLATALLTRMEEAMRERGLDLAYTIARAVSFGMNITFARCGYCFGGTLTNNTQIAGRLEDMNIWYKPLV